MKATNILKKVLLMVAVCFIGNVAAKSRTTASESGLNTQSR